QYTGKELHFDFVSGLDQLPDIGQYAMVIQCGGCMITRKQLLNRLKPAVERGIPVSNYGMAIAYLNGIFDRAVRPFV
ncbi:MAG: [FeFe] hydrogenase H-cluster maturation GTPase HydF, partial [Bacteroidales bacterium]|nr:[FeFe] hydrogenase H-cluster maturation GTPase HydF [Bacteroidales bacterium]